MPLIDDKYIDLIEWAYQKLLNINVIKDNNKTILQKGIVLDIIKKYNEDSQRIKRHHLEIKELSLSRQIGYLTYWIAKLRPINIIDEWEYKGKILYVNSILALIIAFSNISIDSPVLNKRFINEFLYTLHYRPCSGDTISLIIEALLND